MALEGYLPRRIVRRKKNKAEKEIAYLFEKAFHLYEDGQYNDAIDSFAQVCEIVEHKFGGKTSSLCCDSLNTLAALYVATSRQTLAFDLLRESVSVEDKIVDQVFSIASDRQRKSFIKRLQTTLHVFLSLVFQQFSQDQFAIQNALNLVMRRKSIAAEALKVQQEIVLTGKYPQLDSTLLELNDIRREISQKTLAGPSRVEKLGKHKQYLEELNSKKEELEMKLVRHIPEIQIQQSLKTINSKSFLE
jgi:hypothetical protein